METRQFIPDPTPTPRETRYCYECHIQMLPEAIGQLCDVCWTILLSLKDRPYFVVCHREWLNTKRRLLASEGGDYAQDA